MYLATIMRQKKITREIPSQEEVLPFSECIDNLKAIGLDDQEITRLDETLNAVIDNQLDNIFNKYNLE
jgi:hypothetical protein